MDLKELEFYNSIIKAYFGEIDASFEHTDDRDAYRSSNVKYHTQDKKWLCSFVFNRFYSDCNSDVQAVADIHNYVTTEHFDKLIKEYTNRVIDTYTKTILKGIDKDSLKKIEPQRRVGVVCELIVAYLQNNLNISRHVSLPRLLKKQNQIIQIVTRMMKNNTVAQDMIERY